MEHHPDSAYFGCTKCNKGNVLYVREDVCNYRPWRYPSRGEWPEKDGEYEVTLISGEVRIYHFFKEYRHKDILYIRAWRKKPEPAPVIEEEKK